MDLLREDNREGHVKLAGNLGNKEIKHSLILEQRDGRFL